MTRESIGLSLTAAGVATFLASMLLTRAAIHVARRIGFVDRPGGHKSHQTPVSYGGGVAIFISVCVPMAMALTCVTFVERSWITERWGSEIAAYLSGLRERAGFAWVILGGGLAVHVLGLVDDVRPLGAIPKLLALAGVSTMVSIVGDVRLAEFAGPAASVALTVIWMVVVTNAFNFLDNMDGLSAGVACICTAALIACGLLAGQLLIPAMACVFFGAVGGFLVLNFPPARIFMGDSGSLLIGYFLSVVSVLTTYFESGSGRPPYAMAMPLVVLAVPLYDFCSVVVIRLAEGRNPMKGDQRHFSHRLVDRGLSRRGAVLTIYLATASTAAAATLMPRADLRETVTIAVVVLMVLLIVAILEAPLRSKS